MDLIKNIINKYNSDQLYKRKLERLYDNNLKELCSQEIYVLEKCFNYGNREIINKLISCTDNLDVEQAMKNYNSFINDYRKSSFQDKMINKYNNDEYLTDFELFMIKDVIGVVKEEPDYVYYDRLNPILYNSVNELRQTLTNLYFGMHIYELVNNNYPQILLRQKEMGRYAKMDKDLIIESIQELLPICCRFLAKSVDCMLYNVIKRVREGESFYEALKPYICYNTNISLYEIFMIDDEFGKRKLKK